VADRSFTVNGVLLRIGAAIALVLATYNPTSWCYLHWATEGIESFGPPKLVIGLLLAAGWVLYVRAAMQSIGILGAALIAAVIGALVWLAIDSGWLDPANTSALVWIALVGFGLILGIGLSWSHFRRRITGQVDVEGDGPA
jgi:Family of unknown function (DUF6524)